MNTVPIIERLSRLLASMGFSESSIRCQDQPPHLYVHIEAGDAGKLLIGARGAHLTALQHVIHHIIRLNLPAGTRVIVDVNGYRARREQELFNSAAATARRVVAQGQTVILPPMNSADRRVIHTALANREDVATSSTGREPNRSVVIKPVFL